MRLYLFYIGIQVGKCRFARIPGGAAETLFDSQELIVFSDAIGTRGSAGFDLPAIHGDGDISNGIVLGFPASVAGYDGHIVPLRHLPEQN